LIFIFKNVKVPAENLLGESGQRFAILLLGIAMAKVGTSTIALGGMLAAYEEAVRYAKKSCTEENQLQISKLFS